MAQVVQIQLVTKLTEPYNSPLEPLHVPQDSNAIELSDLVN